MNFNNIYKDLTYIIYNTYASEMTSIYEIAKQKYNISYNFFRECINLLESQDIIKVENVNIGVRGGKRSIVLATKNGEEYALKFFDKILQEREAERLLRIHSTLPHGYFNKYCVDALKDAGFEVNDDYESNRIKTSLVSDFENSLVCESDFNIVYNYKKYLFEAETSKCQSDNVKQKLTKMYDLADSDVISATCFYICPNKKACESIKNDIDVWRRENNVYNGFDVIVINASIKDKIAEQVKNAIKKEASA